MTESNNPQSLSDLNEFSIGSIVFDRFKILGEIAAGAQGRIYKAQDTLLDTTVALKVLLTGYKNERDLVRFQSEARMASKMKHPGIATIYDFGIYGSTPFLSMEYVEGESLESLLQRIHTTSLLQFFEIFVQVSRSLEHAHAASIVHRDIKPANIVIARNEDGSLKAKVLDFGVAKNLDIVEERGGKLTPTGNIIGSPYYMSPEQCQGKSTLTTKSDNYSLGCVMWKCLSGEPPFECESVLEMLSMHVNEQPKKISEVVEIPERLAGLIDGLLAKDPDQRPSLKETVIPCLEELLDEHSLSFRQPSDEDDTADGATEKPTLLAYLGSRKHWLALSAVLLICLGLLIFNSNLRSTSSEDLAILTPPDAHKKTHIAAQSEQVGEEYLDEQIDQLKLRNVRKIDMRFLYKEEKLNKLENLPSLERLDVGDTPFSDKQTKHLLRMPNLQYLMMSRTAMVSLDDFGKLKKVIMLELKSTLVTDEAMKNVAQMPQLLNLGLQQTDISDRGVKYLLSSKKLEQLDLSGTKITTQSLHYLSRFPKLRSLSLNQTNVELSGLKEVLDMPTLQDISLEHCKFVDSNVLATLKRDYPGVSFSKTSPTMETLNSNFSEAIMKNDLNRAYRNIYKMVKISERRFDNDSPMTMGYLVALAQVCERLGTKQKEASQAEERVMRFVQRTHNQTIEMSLLQSQLFGADNRGDRETEIAILEKMWKLQEQLTGTKSKEAIGRLTQLAEKSKSANQTQKALLLYRTAVDGLKSVENADPNLLLECQLQVGDCLRILGKDSESEIIFNGLIRKLQARPKVSGKKAIVLFHSYAGLSIVLMKRGKPLDALKQTDKMLELIKTGGIPLVHAGVCFRHRADYLDALGRIEESKTYRSKYMETQTELNRRAKAESRPAS